MPIISSQSGHHTHLRAPIAESDDDRILFCWWFQLDWAINRLTYPKSLALAQQATQGGRDDPRPPGYLGLAT